MRMKSKKVTVLAALVGCLMPILGCLNVNQALRTGLNYVAFEFLTDGGVFDVFPDGPATAN